MIIFLFIAFVVITLSGFVTLRHALTHAVEGYEDESGFRECTESSYEEMYRTSHSETFDDGWIAQQSVHHGTLPPFPSKL
jgi:hypothetical protein